MTNEEFLKNLKKRNEPSVQPPDTLPECLNLMRKYSNYCDYYDADRNAVVEQISKLSKPRLLEILEVVLGSPKGACVPDTTDMDFTRYSKLDKSEGRYSGELYFKSLHSCDLAGRKVETASFQYVNGEDDGYPEYGYITVQTAWLTMDYREMVSAVRNIMYQDLLNYIDKLRKELVERTDALESLEARIKEVSTCA